MSFILGKVRKLAVFPCKFQVLEKFNQNGVYSMNFQVKSLSVEAATDNSSPNPNFKSASAGKLNRLPEWKMNVNNVDINYTKVGDGPHVVLCLPGMFVKWPHKLKLWINTNNNITYSTLSIFNPHLPLQQNMNLENMSSSYNLLFLSAGTIQTDMEPIILKMDKEKFTIVCWDPPGYYYLTFDISLISQYQKSKL